MELNPLGDILVTGAAFVWGCYSVLIKKINDYGYPVIQTTRRIFAYGLLFMILVLFLSDFRPEFSRFADPVYLFNILYLGLGASALCFVTWNFAARELGAVKSSVYIYLNPVITVVASALILKESVTGMAVAGTLLTLAGLIISEMKTSHG